jgi:hypothetical protein
MLEKPKCVKVTRSLAKQFSEMDAAPHDRNFSATRGSFIKAAIVEGRFRVADFASVKCKETRKTYRVNGKHTSMVLCELNGDMPSDLFAVVEEYEADTLEDVAKLYATFDHRKSLRTTGDINKAFAAVNPDLAELPSRIINASTIGLSFATWEEGYYGHEVDERAALLLANPNFVLWVYLLLSGHGSDHSPLCRGPIVAAMYRTFQKSQKQSSEFWELVRDESHPDSDNATRALGRWIATHSIKSGVVRGKHIDSRRGIYVRSIHAWNAWRRNETTDLRYHHDKPTPQPK